MSSEWKSYQLGDIFDLVNGFAFKGGEFKSSGIPVIKIKNVKPNNLLLSDLAFVDKDVADKRPDKELKRGDILITMSGNRMDGSRDTWVGKVAYFDIPGRYMLNQRVGVLRPKKGVEVDRKCCSYFLSSDEFQDFFIAVATSSGGQANLSPSQILGEKINLPPLAEQKQIASLLTSLDDRITLLRETNTTLEAIAQALFKSWFVDFDPVHAKMQGRAPEGMDEATAALFPDSIEESELGSVPKGWRVGNLNVLAELNPESWSAKRHPERVLYVDLANTKAGQIDEYIEFSFEDAPSRARRVLRCGDVIVGTVRPGNRSFARIASDVTGLTGSTGFAVLRARKVIDQALVFIAATNDEAIDRLSHLADGGAYPAVRPEVVGSTPLVVATEEIRNSFGDIANTLFASIGANQERMTQLASLRDTLLPRLISGQIDLNTL